MKKKYSDWLKIDLHIHTDWSKKTKENDYQGDFSISRLKEKLIENEVSVFSLTDHNIINIDAYKEYYKDYDVTKDPLLLLGVELDIVVSGNTGSKTYHSLLIFNYTSVEDAENINQRLENCYTQKTIPAKERKLTIDEVIALFPEDDFFFIPHAGNTKSIVDAYKPHNVQYAQMMVLLMQSTFEKVAEKKRQRYNEGFDTTLHEAFRNKNDNAYIEFSDNHNCEKYPCTGKGDDNNLHSFYYVKGGKNFETLRLAFIDPESRIKSYEEYQHIIKLSNYIESIQILNNDILEDNEIMLSPHMNVLIGGRSSGKSLMMSILGEKIDSVSIDKGKYNKVNYDNIKIKSKLDADYQSSTSITKDEIIYIKQGDIVRYFEENKLEELAIEANKLEEYKAAKEQFKLHKQALSLILDSVINNYTGAKEFDINKRIVLHQATIDKILNKNFILKCDHEKLISTFDLSTDIENASNVIETLKVNSKELKENKIFEITSEEADLITKFEALLVNKFALIEAKKNRIGIKINFISAVNTLLNSKNQELNAEAQSKVEAIATHKKLIDEVGKQFGLLNSLKSVCYKLEGFDYSLKQEIIVSNGVKLTLEVEKATETKELILEGITSSNNSLSLYINFLGLLKGTKAIKNYTNTNSDSLKKKIDRQLEDLSNKLNNPKDYLDYNNGDTSKNNSPGFNSEKYLEIILNNPTTKLILIDQPEDNLGNKFVADNLVSMLRKIKFKKQVILVTHNPSVVVYGDAENVIIAENNSNKITYRQVVLENESSQREICKILDGGEYIFDMRSRKYNIQKILKTN